MLTWLVPKLIWKRFWFWKKKSRFPFVTKSPSRIRCGRVLVTLLVAATASHLNAASSVFLLNGWSVQAYTLAPYQSNLASLSCLPSSLFWRGFILGQEVTRRHIIRLDHESWPASTVHYSIAVISFSWTTPLGLIELSALICYWVTLLY